VKRFRYRLEAALLTPALWVVPFLPYPAARRIGRYVGWVSYWFMGGQRRTALANLDVAFGGAKTHREKTRIDCQEFPYQPSGNNQADIQTISQRCLDFCEAVIRDRPEHWLWSYERWKARPHSEQGRFPAYSRQYGV
jgi:lauroyl/myristoyl acyltransferase